MRPFTLRAKLIPKTGIAFYNKNIPQQKINGSPCFAPDTFKHHELII